MGIRGLWAAFSPYCDKKSLHEIGGERLAVDLAGWVCDSQNVTDHQAQPKLYLRNLFFRTSYLLLAEMKPVFVLEGDAPDLKRDEMARRNALQFRGAAPQCDGATKRRPDIARKRFKGVLRECEKMLRYMGVCCVKGSGEAEATCAYLNAEGLVDAVISQDSDCFAYGARRVYRNFSVSSSAGGGALQGSVDCYDAATVSKEIGFGRNKMVGLALLCGCDYGAGAAGSPVATALAFLHTLADEDVLPRLVSWASEPELYASLESWARAPGRCGRCGHAGRSHARGGCPLCATHTSCHDTGHKAKLAAVRRELALRARALSCGAPFPDPRVVQEFLRAEEAPRLPADTQAPAPSLIQFVKLMGEKLGWSERYCVEKFLPLLTRWHLRPPAAPAAAAAAAATLRTVRINKKRTPRGVPSFEVVWRDLDGHYDGLVPDDQLEEGENHEVIWTTTERQDLMRLRYPDLVVAYEESIKKPAKDKKSRGRRKKETDSPPKSKPKRKYTKKTQKIVNEMENLNLSMNNMTLGKRDKNDLQRKGKVLELKDTSYEPNDDGSERKDANFYCQDSRLKINDNNTLIHNSGSMQNNTSVLLGISVNKLKRKLKASKKQKTMDSFVGKKRKSLKLIESLRDSFKNISINDVGKENIVLGDNDGGIGTGTSEMSTVDVSDDSFGESDLSDLVDRIVTRDMQPKTTRVDNNLVKLIFSKGSTTPQRIKADFRRSVLGEVRNNSSTPKQSPRKKGDSRLSKFHSNYSSPEIGKMESNKYSSRRSRPAKIHTYDTSAVHNNSMSDIIVLDDNERTPVVSTSYFFDKLTDDVDVFELSTDYKIIDDYPDADKTVEYSFNNSFL